MKPKKTPRLTIEVQEKTIPKVIIDITEHKPDEVKIDPKGYSS